MTDLPWTKLPTWIAREGVLRDLSPSAPKLLIALLSHADENGSIRMAQPEAARLAGISMSTAKRCYTELMELGIIEILEPKIGRQPAHIRVCGVSDDRSCTTGHTRPVMRDTTTEQNSPSMTGHACGVMDDRSWVTPLRPFDRSWVTPQDTHIGTGVRRKEDKREREESLSGFQDWSAEARMVIDDPESAASFRAFLAKHPVHPEDTAAHEFVAVLLVRYPKAFKLGWTVPMLVKLAGAFASHQHLTLAQAVIELDLLGDSKTRMSIPQLDEVTKAIKARERSNLRRERVCGDTPAHERDQEFIGYIAGIKPDHVRAVLQATRRSIVEAHHGQSEGDNLVALHWDARLGSDPLDTLKHDWLAETASGRWLRSRAIEATQKAKESA